MTRGLSLIAACTVMLCGSPAIGDEECVLLTEPTRCLLQGRLFARAVDSSRFLVAVDLQDESGQSNGEVDHLFLFAGNEPPKDLPAGIIVGSLWIDTEGGIADIWPKGQKPIPIQFKDLPTSHYWGIGSNKGRIEWLENLEPASECDHYEGSCWVANGWRIGFPL